MNSANNGLKIPGVLHGAADPAARALQGDVPRRRLLPHAAAGRAPAIHHIAAHLPRHLLLHDRAQPGLRALPHCLRRRPPHGPGRHELRWVRFTMVVELLDRQFMLLSLPGYFISCAAGNLPVALEVMTPLLIPLMLFGGLFISIE